MRLPACPNDCWQCHRVESLKSEESAEKDQKLWNVCLHALFRRPYAPNHHSPKMGAHFAPHRATFSRPLLNIRTHFLTMPSLIALSPYTWQIWWWLSLGSTFLAFKKRITDRISQSAAPSIVLNMFNARNKHKHNTNFTKWRLWLLNW